MQITEKHADDLYTAMGCIDSVIATLNRSIFNHSVADKPDNVLIANLRNRIKNLESVKSNFIALNQNVIFNDENDDGISDAEYFAQYDYECNPD